LVRKRQLALGLVIITGLEAGTVAAAAVLWGMPGFVVALVAVLTVGELPVAALVDRCSVPSVGAESLPGRCAVVVRSGANGPADDRQTGRVRLDGVLWKARTASADTPMPPPGTTVQVTAVSGLVLEIDGDARTGSRSAR